MAGHKGIEARGTFLKWTGQSITNFITYRKAELRKDAAGVTARSGTICVQPNIGTVWKATLGDCRWLRRICPGHFTCRHTKARVRPLTCSQTVTEY